MQNLQKSCSAFDGVDEALAAALVDAENTTVDALAELSIVEVLEIQDVGNDSASAVIMAAEKKKAGLNNFNIGVLSINN